MNPIFKTMITNKLKDNMADWVEADPVDLTKVVCMNHDETQNHSWIYDGNNVIWIPEGNVEDVVDWLNMHKLFSVFNSVSKLTEEIVIHRDPYHIVGSVFYKYHIINESENLQESTCVLNGYKLDPKINDIQTYISLDDNVDVLKEIELYTDVVLVFKNVDSYMLSAIQFFTYLTPSEQFFNIEKSVTIGNYTLCHFKKRNKSEFNYYAE